MSLGVKADDVGLLALVEVEEERGASEAAVGDDDGTKGRGSQVEHIGDELALDLVLTVELDDSRGREVGALATTGARWQLER